MRHVDRPVSSVAELINFLRADRVAGQPIWFRGQENSEWSLLPSISRGGGVDVEFTLFKRFKQNALPFIEHRPENEWEWLFLMQHHGLPTRLLDWTEAPLVALYFAVADPASDAHDGSLWALLPQELNTHSRLEAGHPADIPGFGDDEHLNAYLPSQVAKKGAGLDPLAAIATRNNLRVQAQQGVFTVCHKEIIPIERDRNVNYLWHYTIPADAKRTLRGDLEILNLNKLSMFPELSNVAAHARSLV